jgi:hypothetical protein
MAGGPIGDNKGWYCPSCGKAIYGADGPVPAKRDCPNCGTIEDQPWAQVAWLVIAGLAFLGICFPNPVSGICWVIAFIYLGWKALQWLGKQSS